jgi:hypothetical protein
MNNTGYFPLLPMCAAASIVAALSVPRASIFWGERGHLLVGEVAADIVPEQMPNFFRGARTQLRYLNPEPDRWRSREERIADAALDEATAPEHFVDLELLPPARTVAILSAPSRVAFADSLRRLGLSATKVGLLPFRILELTQELRVEFRLWRATTNARDREWIEQRIINDAGILGHYVADGAQPQHTSVHFNGWTGPNPKGFTTDNHVHARFETEFVQARVAAADVRPLANAAPIAVDELRAAILAFVGRSNAEIERLYELDKRVPFNAHTMSAEHKQFAAERLAAGAVMLRDLWWTAWVTSEGH